MSGWIGVDLDRTLAFYDGWEGELVIGEPIPLMLNRVKAWVAEGREVRIVTARVAPGSFNEDGSSHNIAEVRSAIEDWCEKHVGVRLQVTNEKDNHMYQLWDDRAIQVEPNTGIQIGLSE